MIFHWNGDTVRIGWASGSKCPYLQFDPDANRVRVEFHDDEYNIMLPNGWHRYRSMPETQEFVIDRKLIAPESATGVVCSWGIGECEWHTSSIENCTIYTDGTTNGADCKTITLGTTMIDGNSFVSSSATFNDNAAAWWTIFASAAACIVENCTVYTDGSRVTEPESPTEKKQPEPEDDWERKARRRTEDNLRQFFGE